MSKRNPLSYRASEAAGQSSGPAIWRSLAEKNDPARRLDAATSEPEVSAADDVSITHAPLVQLGAKKGAASGSEKGGFGRRSFLAGSAITAALAASGCARRPVEHILPYARQPEYTLPGIALHYATALAHRGEAIGVLVESHEGRPTKIEGNPEHRAGSPDYRGRDSRRPHAGTDIQTQASILGLYDQDRSATVMRRDGESRAESSWSEFDEAFTARLASLESTGGRGLRFLAESITSPTLLAAKRAVLTRFPEARFHTWSSVHDGNAREGARTAFGQPMHTLVDYSQAQVVVSLDCDFLSSEQGSVRSAKLFAAGRRLRSSTDDMNRLYVVESTFSITGATADHRLRLKSRDVEGYARALASALSQNGADLGPVAAALGEPGIEIPEQWTLQVARDLIAHRGRAVVVVGSRQPARVHALAHAINAALGSLGTLVATHSVLDTEETEPTASLASLVEDMNGGNVGTLVMLGGNPVYDAPADLAFRDALGHVEVSIHLASHDDETSELCTWHLPMTHELESWGDHRSLDGTLAIQQPLVAPLRGGRNAIELVGFASGERSWRAFHAVRRTFATIVPNDVFERTWRAALHRGVVPGTESTAVGGLAPNAAAIATALAERGSGEGIELVFVPCPKAYDGRSINNPWLLELPDPITKISWDNVAWISPSYASQLGARNGDMLRISAAGNELEIPAFIVPGHADDSVTLLLGWGRTRAGHFANGVGVDVSPLRASAGLGFSSGATVQRGGSAYSLAQTQEHHSMEGRPLAIDATLEQYREQPDFAQWREPTPTTPPLWDEVDYSTPQPPAQGGTSWSLIPEQRPPDPEAGPRHKWGMVVDLTTCTGCNACVIACNAENNIATVGKQQVALGREMHWLRIDRYFVGESESDPQVAFQPVACQHCEEAPCENVCPVNATAHSPEGLNEMAYNRCIGTRYCMNNCPYKVRRFNFLAYQGHITELQQMQFNPNVSVRMRGVMEKCTYCVQRIQAARIASRNDGNRRIREDEITPACASACPSEALVFGDLNDESHLVTQLASVDRHYRLLALIGTQPRTTYLGRIRNPNREMV